jgi:hypothetical protein
MSEQAVQDAQGDGAVSAQDDGQHFLPGDLIHMAGNMLVDPYDPVKILSVRIALIRKVGGFMQVTEVDYAVSRSLEFINQAGLAESMRRAFLTGFAGADTGWNTQNAKILHDALLIRRSGNSLSLKGH